MFKIKMDNDLQIKFKCFKNVKILDFSLYQKVKSVL